jgi:hypothetical protein
MTLLASRVFHVCVKITVTIRDIDETLAAETKQQMNNEALANDPWTAGLPARDQRLLAVVVSTPEARERQLLQQLAFALDRLHPNKQVLVALGRRDLTDAQLIAALRDALAANDCASLRELCEEGVLYDNASFYQIEPKTPDCSPGQRSESLLVWERCSLA